MRFNWNQLMSDVCDIERPDVDIDTTTIRDRRVTEYDVVASSQRCYFEAGAVGYNYDDRLGQIAVKTFTVFFQGRVDVQEGDRLLKSSTYYLVRSVQDYSSQGFGVVCIVEKKNYPMVVSTTCRPDNANCIIAQLVFADATTQFHIDNDETCTADAQGCLIGNMAFADGGGVFGG